MSDIETQETIWDADFRALICAQISAGYIDYDSVVEKARITADNMLTIRTQRTLDIQARNQLG